MLRVGTDCSGIEAPLFALQKLKVRYSHEFSCEIDRHATATLLANHKPKKFYKDITARSIKSTPSVDLYVCGFPCQPFSTAGGKKGFQDPRGTIFDYCCRYIKHHRPKVYVLENVPGLLTHDQGRTMETIERCLNKIRGYVITKLVLNALDYGLPQRRRRLFIVGRRADIVRRPLATPAPVPLRFRITTLPAQTAEPPITRKTHPHLFRLSPCETDPRKFAALRRKYKLTHLEKHPVVARLYSLSFLASGLNVSPTLTAIDSQYYVTSLKRKFSPREALALQGFPPRMKIVVSDRQVFKQAGNSIAIDVLVHLFREIFASTSLRSKKTKATDGKSSSRRSSRRPAEPRPKRALKPRRLAERPIEPRPKRPSKRSTAPRPPQPRLVATPSRRRRSPSKRRRRPPSGGGRPPSGGGPPSGGE
uniref:DNA (cytosine-5-)-methyltransferase n=1 Tax=Marseillevirus LCMAC103 TaxID=2506604 RepID=A0A481YVE4_9VIRU|nr:MAG: uncharacterized protein LCMAC103_02090 [Marseillevirus LCMAC103]